MPKTIALFVLFSAAAAPLHARQFPAAAVAETRRLVFHVSSPATGTLEAQVRGALRELAQKNGGATLVKLRAFAVGAPDLAATRAAIARGLRATHTPLPVLSLIGVAGFPDSTQRVEIESSAISRTTTSPQGVGFLAGLASATGDRTIAGLARVAREAGISAADIERISCFYEQDAQVAPARTAIASTFPGAEASFVFSFAASARPAIECEAVARLSTAPPTEIQYFNLSGAPASPNYAHAALVAAQRVVFTGSDMAISANDSGMTAMMERMKSAAARFGARLSNVVMGNNYWITPAGRDTIRVVRARYFGGTVPAATGVFFNALESIEAVAGLELVVAIPRAGGDTVTLAPGNPMMDRRYLLAHRVEVTETRTRGGVETPNGHYSIDKSVVQLNGRPAYHLQIHALPGSDDTSRAIDILLDHQTMGLIRRTERDGSGRVQSYDVDGPRIRQSLTPARDSATVTSEYVLDQPAFLVSFLDAVANAVQLREGLVMRVPAFGLVREQTTADWHVLRVARRDTIRIGDHVASAWVVEQAPENTVASRTFWLVREPPYFPRVVTVFTDGSIQRTEQHLRP